MLNVYCSCLTWKCIYQRFDFFCWEFSKKLSGSIQFFIFFPFISSSILYFTRSFFYPLFFSLLSLSAFISRQRIYDQTNLIYWNSLEICVRRRFINASSSREFFKIKFRFRIFEPTCVTISRINNWIPAFETFARVVTNPKACYLTFSFESFDPF